jgi:hypothetical protein
MSLAPAKEAIHNARENAIIFEKTSEFMIAPFHWNIYI